MSLENIYLTDAGNALLARAQTGETLTFTRAQVGEGTWPAETTYANLTALVTPVKYMNLTGASASGGQTKVGVQFSNSGVGRLFQWTEFALWAADPDYPDDRSHDILYASAYAGDTPIPISSTLTEFLFNVILKTDRAANITVVVDSSLVYVTNTTLTEALEKYVKKTGDTMSGSLEIDGGTDGKTAGVRRTLSDGSKALVTLGLGTDGSAVLTLSQYAADGTEPTRTDQAGLDATGFWIGSTSRHAAEDYGAALASGTTLLAFANGCTVSTIAHITSDALPSDAPVSGPGHAAVLVGPGGRKDVLFLPYGDAVQAVYTRGIANSAWLGDGWSSLGGIETGHMVTIPATGWEEDEDAGNEFAYVLELDYAGIQATDGVEITVDPDSIEMAVICGLCPTVTPGSGTLTFRARSAPTQAIQCYMTVYEGNRQSEDAPGYGNLNTGYPVNPNQFEPAGSVSDHNQDPYAHPDIRAEMVTATVQVSYNGG